MNDHPPVPGDNLDHRRALQYAAQVADLTGANLPLAPGLRAAAGEIDDRRLRRALEELADRVDAGQPLGEAIAAQYRRLPGYLRALANASTGGRQFAPLLAQVVACQRDAADARRAVWLSVAYPLLLALAATAMFLAGVALLGPVISQTHEDLLGLYYWQDAPKVPVSARLLNWLDTNIRAVIAVAIAVPIAVYAAARLPLLNVVVLRIAKSLPVIGPLIQNRAMAQFNQFLALLVEQQTTLPEAIAWAGEAVGDPDIVRASRQLARRVSDGEPLSDAIDQVPSFSPSMTPFVRWGEQNNALPDSLWANAEFFIARLRLHTELARTILPPVAFVYVAALVLVMLGALLIPLVQLIESLS